ncbi:MAG: DUF2807 domain-containing protein [Pseudomonadota bacterium]
MKSTFYIFATALMLVATVDAKDANAKAIVAQSYPVSSVLEVNAGGGIEVDIIQGDSESLRVETTPETMKRVKVDLTGHKLTLGLKNDSFDFFNWFSYSSDHVKFILHIKRLSLLDFSGAVQANVSNFRGETLVLKSSGAAQMYFSDLRVNDLDIESSGAANTEIQTLNSQKINVELSGASNVHLRKSGTAGQFTVEASGASNFHGKSLTVVEADARASGASNIEVRAMETLKANASGASTIDYYGSAKVSSDASGASHINGHE